MNAVHILNDKVEILFAFELVIDLRHWDAHGAKRRKHTCLMPDSQCAIVPVPVRLSVSTSFFQDAHARGAALDVDSSVYASLAALRQRVEAAVPFKRRRLPILKRLRERIGEPIRN